MKNGDIGYVFVLDNNGNFISHPIYIAKGNCKPLKKEAVQAMHEGNKEVPLGSDVVNRTGAIFADIETRIQEVNTQVGLAHAAMIDSDTANTNISHSVDSVDGISKNTSSEAQNVSAATQEQAASMEEMSTASLSLATLAQDLQNSVNKFKI